MEILQEAFTPEENARHSAKMGKAPIPRLLLGMAWPIILSMAVQAVYNIMDSVFSARIPGQGEAALSALGYTYPIQMLMIAIAVGTGAGMNALISKRLGQRRVQDANIAAGNGFLLLILSSLVFVGIGLLLPRFMMRLFTQDAEIIELGAIYLRICCCFSIGLFMQIGMERMMTAQGKTIYAMVIQMAGALINIALDRVFVLGWWFVPPMGVAGAAISTVVGQILAMLLCLPIVLGKKHEVRMQIRHFRPRAKVIGKIYRVGLPSIVMQGIGVTMLLGLNWVLSAYGSVAAAVFNVYYKCQSLVFMPAFGITHAAMSIFAYNYGAKNPKRILRTFWVALLYATVFTGIGLLVFQLLPEPLLATLFRAEGELLRIGTVAFRTISICFLPAALSIMAGTLFTSLGRATHGMWVSLIRQLVVLLPAAFLLSWIFKSVTAVWWSYPIAEAFALALSIWLFLREKKRIIDVL
ncbi:MAG: MATE family efflux transporter [Clostridiales bacterium]|nr:MATE family efflux transporter [Clostridiales bacterium]